MQSRGVGEEGVAEGNERVVTRNWRGINIRNLNTNYVKSHVTSSKLWQRPRELGDFKQVGHFAVKF